MAQKISNKIKTASDNMVHRFASSKNNMTDSEKVTPGDTYDLIIEELDYVNTQIAKIDGKRSLYKRNTPQHNNTTGTSTKYNPDEWVTVSQLQAYFPKKLCSELTEKLCQLQPTMPDKIIKIGRHLELHTSAIPAFAVKAGLKMANPNTKSTTAAKTKAPKKQVMDDDKIVYVIGQRNKSIAMD